MDGGSSVVMVQPGFFLYLVVNAFKKCTQMANTRTILGKVCLVGNRRYLEKVALAITLGLFLGSGVSSVQVVDGDVASGCNVWDAFVIGEPFVKVVELVVRGCFG